jgi:hypothetical protein
MSQNGDNDGNAVMMSDFGDCFLVEYNLAISREIEAPSVQEHEQGRSLPPPQSVVIDQRPAVSSVLQLPTVVSLKDTSDTRVRPEKRKSTFRGPMADFFEIRFTKRERSQDATAGSSTSGESHS